MLFVRGPISSPLAQSEWTASAFMDADAEDVLDALTDPNAISAWAPVSFEVEGLARGRLEAGGRERVTGCLAGLHVSFDITVRRADLEGLELTARGPVRLEVAYRFVEYDDEVFVEATVRVIPQGGLTAQLLRGAVSAVLNAGALGSALRRIEACVERRVESELVAA
jgi:Polyketide cyclase / dehydrase and lipid transport